MMTACAAAYRATCGVTSLAVINSRNILVVRSITRDRTTFYFSQRLLQRNFWTLHSVKADFHSVQFSERAEFWDRFLLKYVLSCRTNFIRLDCTHFKRKRSQNSARSLNCNEWKSALTSLLQLVSQYFC